MLYYCVGKLHVYERGVVFCHPHQGSIVIPKGELSAIHLYDGVRM